MITNTTNFSLISSGIVRALKKIEKKFYFLWNAVYRAPSFRQIIAFPLIMDENELYFRFPRWPLNWAIGLRLSSDSWNSKSWRPWTETETKRLWAKRNWGDIATNANRWMKIATTGWMKLRAASWSTIRRIRMGRSRELESSASSGKWLSLICHSLMPLI